MPPASNLPGGPVLGTGRGMGKNREAVGLAYDAQADIVDIKTYPNRDARRGVRRPQIFCQHEIQ
jgi:hypothetical protein